MNVPKIRAVIDISFIQTFIAGPLVSLRGSPTVSPQTAAVCSISPFLTIDPSLPGLRNSSGRKRLPASTYFFALSHAPPVLEAENAIYIPETMLPASIPLTNLYPSRIPHKIGDRTTRAAGAIIFLSDALVAMATHLSWSG